MAKLSFSDWLKSRGIDETKLKGDEKNKLVSFHENHYFNEPEPPPAKDSAGQAVAVGDTVTMTFTVTGVHARLHQETGLELSDGTADLNLALDGRHFISVQAKHVKKVP